MRLEHDDESATPRTAEVARALDGAFDSADAWFPYLDFEELLNAFSQPSSGPAVPTEDSKAMDMVTPRANSQATGLQHPNQRMTPGPWAAVWQIQGLQGPQWWEEKCWVPCVQSHKRV